MATDSHQLAALESAIQSHADPQRAIEQQRYLKSPRQHLGLRVPELRRIVREWANDFHIQEPDQAWLLAEQLWQHPTYEYCAAAVELLAYRQRVVQIGDFAKIRSMLETAQTWALVDPLSTEVAGRFILREPEQEWGSTLDQWATDQSFWVRRSSMLSQMRHLRSPAADATRFFRYADSMLAEREFFIQKAIGWVLRDMSKSRPEEVAHWVAPRAHVLSTVALREAVKYLTPRQRAMIESNRNSAAQ